MKYSTISSVLLSTLLLISCSNEQSTEIEGEWISICSNLSNGTSVDTIITFAGNKYDTLAKHYNDRSCIKLIDSFKTTGTFVIGNTIVTTSGLEANEIDLTSNLIGEKEENITSYDIFSIIQEKLYMGIVTNELSKRSKNNRPTELDFTLPLTRK